MRHNGTIFTTLAVTAVLATTPAAAGASPLLNGYGGPGAGAQQIIGAGLVNGGGGRGGGPRTGSGGNSPASGGGSNSASEGGGGVSSSSGGPSGGSSPAGSGSGSSSSAGSGSTAGNGPAGEAQGSSASAREAGAARAAVPAATLGLSGAELLTALLIAAGLVLTAVSTMWLSNLKRDRQYADTKPMNLGGSH